MFTIYTILNSADPIPTDTDDSYVFMLSLRQRNITRTNERLLSLPRVLPTHSPRYCHRFMEHVRRA